MNLNISLPESLKLRLQEKTAEPTAYCISSEIDLEGNYTDSFYIGATRSLIFVFDNTHLETIKISECDSVDIVKLVGNGVFTVKKGDEFKILARFTNKTVTQFVCVARGINRFIDGKLDAIVTNNEREKECFRCKRVLPSTGICPKCDRKNRNVLRIFSLCSSHKAVLTLIFIIMLIVTAVNLGQQFLMRWFIDEHLSKGQGTVWDIALFIGTYVVLVALVTLGSLLRSYLCRKLGINITSDLRTKLGKHIQKLSMSFFTNRDIGGVMERIFNDTFQIRHFFSNCFCDMFSQAITLVVLVVVMLVLNWKLAVAAFIFVPFIVVFAKTFWPYIRKIFHRQRRKGDRIQSKLQDVLSGIRIVKSYGRESSEIKEFCSLNQEYAEVQHKNERFFATVLPLLTLMIAFGSYLIIYIGGLDVLKGKMTVGELVQFVSYSGMLLGPLNWMTFLPKQIVGTTTSLDRIYDVLDEQPDIVSSDNAIKLDVKGDIAFEDVVFGYNSYEPVLEGINLKVKAGEMIGFVGASGTGKSTMINLIMRLYDPLEGKITIDGVDLKELEKAHYHSQIGVVLQETFLFAGTVAENIRYAKQTATDEEIIRAAKIANAHEFICRLPDGYNTYVGEKGHRLSGGEKQRIAIARAILTDPKILILDEATSALDTESEYLIQQALERLRQGRTTFAIAHRLSTLRCADRLVVIDDKKIAEIGTHNELLKKKGIYYDLVMAQLEMNGK